MIAGCCNLWPSWHISNADWRLSLSWSWLTGCLPFLSRERFAAWIKLCSVASSIKYTSFIFINGLEILHRNVLHYFSEDLIWKSIAHCYLEVQLDWDLFRVLKSRTILLYYTHFTQLQVLLKRTSIVWHQSVSLTHLCLLNLSASRFCVHVMTSLSHYNQCI